MDLISWFTPGNTINFAELKFRNSYKAFTLWEMIVVMVVISILVTLSYGAYNKFTLMLENDQQTTNDLIEMIWLEKEIHRIIESSLSAELINAVVYFNLQAGEMSLAFLDSLMIVDLWDTEPLEVHVDEWSVGYLDNSSDYIKSISIDCRLDKENYRMSFGKTYPKAFLYTNDLNGLKPAI